MTSIPRGRGVQLRRLEQAPAVAAGLRVEALLTNATEEHNEILGLREALAYARAQSIARKKALTAELAVCALSSTSANVFFSTISNARIHH